MTSEILQAIVQTVGMSRVVNYNRRVLIKSASVVNVLNILGESRFPTNPKHNIVCSNAQVCMKMHSYGSFQAQMYAKTVDYLDHYSCFWLLLLIRSILLVFWLLLLIRSILVLGILGFSRFSPKKCFMTLITVYIQLQMVTALRLYSDAQCPNPNKLLFTTF